MAFLILYPALVVPVAADDFLNPFNQFISAGPSLSEAIGHGWNTSYNGGSFRIAGNILGAILGWLSLQLAGHQLLSLRSFACFIRFVSFTSALFSAAFMLRTLANFMDLRVSFKRSCVMVSIFLFGFIQIHTIWSNDPVTNYPIAGFIGTSLAIFYATLVIQALSNQNPGRNKTFLVTILGVLAVTIYETAIFLCLFFVVVYISKLTLEKFSMKKAESIVAIGIFPMFVIPIAVIIWGRTRTAEVSQSYGGTTIRLGGTAFRTFLRNFTSDFPFASWNLSQESLNGETAISLGAVLVFSGVILLLPRVIVTSQVTGAPQAHLYVQMNWVYLTFIGLLGYFVGSVSLQSATVKIQNETTRIGHVYTHYATGHVVLAILFGFLSIIVLEKIGFHKLISLTVILAVLAFVQFNVNWRISKHLQSGLIPNSQIFEAFSNAQPVQVRCSALRNWTDGNWPEFYENQLVQGVQASYLYFHGVEFCPVFVR